MIDIIPQEEGIVVAPDLENLMFPHLATVVATSTEAEIKVPPGLPEHQVVVETNLIKMVVIEGPPPTTPAAGMHQKAETLTTILLVHQTIMLLTQQIGEIGIGKEIVNTQIKGMIKMIEEAEVSTINLGRATMAVVALI